jgi:hypothetical protein
VKLALPIARINQYRLFAPIIDEALRRGWDVECWHDYRQPAGMAKVDQFPRTDDAPAFRYGVPRFRTYQDSSQLCELSRDPRVDVVVSLFTRDFYSSKAPAANAPVWVALQHFSELFYHSAPDALLACDVPALYSDWWVRWAAETFSGDGRITDAGAFERALAAKAAIVGFPALDATTSIDPERVRARHGIPAGRPVAVLLPFPQGVGKASFWPSQVFGEPRPARRLFNVLLHRRFEYLPHVRYGWSDVRLVTAVREFCDKNGLFLIVKSRVKTPIPEYTRALADLCVYDESQYPATILELLSVADVCLSFYSAGVTEAVALGVPHVCLAFDVDDYLGADRIEAFKRVFNRNEGGLFQFAGVSTSIGIPEAIETLAGKTLGDFRMDTDARGRYLTRFLGYDDRSGSRRTLDAIERAVADRPRS